FARLQTLPTGGRPISQWPDRDEAYASIVTGLRRRINKLWEQRTVPGRQQPPESQPDLADTTPTGAVLNLPIPIVPSSVAMHRLREARDDLSEYVERFSLRSGTVPPLSVAIDLRSQLRDLQGAIEHLQTVVSPGDTGESAIVRERFNRCLRMIAD